MKDRPNVVRVNLNVTLEQRELLAKNAKQANMTMTAFVLKRCSVLDDPQDKPKQAQAKDADKTLLEVKLKALERELSDKVTTLTEQLERERTELQERKQELTEHKQALFNKDAELKDKEDLLDFQKQRYERLLQEIAFNNLPWYKKLGKRKELPNR